MTSRPRLNFSCARNAFFHLVCKSAVSATSSSLASLSLSSGPHPHDTVPINSSDIFRKSSYGSTGSAGPDGVTRRKNPPKQPQSRLMNTLGVHTHGIQRNRVNLSVESDPFALLNDDEI